MKNKNDSISLDLPLSWVRSKRKSLKKNTFRFKTSNLDWVSLAEVPEEKHFQQILCELQKTSARGLLIRGCTTQIANQLKLNKFDILPIGQEAVLNLTKKLDAKKSIKELIRRGKKYGSYNQIKLTDENILKLACFKKESRHGHKPQLKHLFIDEFTKNTQAFVWENFSGEWQAVITISKVNDQKMQTELLLRKKRAPIGTMEALIFEVSEYLKKAGYKDWSLGEVPFILSKENRLFSRSYFLAWLGRKLRFAYNAESLYNFKNKFSPTWQPVYLCGYPKISVLSLLELSFRSNYLRLVLSRIFRRDLIKKKFTGSRINQL